MQNHLKIAFVTPEHQSLVRRTNLAEISESLPRTLRDAGHDVRLIMPLTKDLQSAPLRDVQTVGELVIPIGKLTPEPDPGIETVEIKTAMVGTQPVILIDHPQLFRSRHPYGNENGPYEDNWRRFSVFARAVIECLPMLGFQPDVVHCMDWTTGLIPLYRELEYVVDQPDHPISKAGIYFAIQNLAMQGSFEREILPKIGLPPEIFQHVNGVAHEGRVNYLKAGAEFATIIGSTSPAQAERIQQLDRGYGLEETFQRRKKELVGVASGIDYKTWDPGSDSMLSSNYSLEDQKLDGKRRCKGTLQRTLKLDNGPRTPLLALIGRIDADSGFDLLAEIMTAVLERSFQIVMMGAGQPEILERIKTIQDTFVGRCRLIEGYHVQTAHATLAGADMLVMPSHYQPSNALCAIGMRYGAVPVIYEHSGLDDTVVTQLEDQKNHTGIAFRNYNGEGLLEGLDEARAIYKSADDWRGIARRCMEQDFSWQATGVEYVKAYRRVTRRVRAQRSED